MHNVWCLSRDWSDIINSHPKFKLRNRMQSHEHAVMIEVHLVYLLRANLAKYAKLLNTDLTQKIVHNINKVSRYLVRAIQKNCLYIPFLLGHLSP